MVQILAEHHNSHSRLARAERDTDRQLRAALIRVGGYLGLDERMVIRFTETIAGRTWSRCGAAQVVEVGKCLLDIAVALKCEHQPAVPATPGPRAIGFLSRTAATVTTGQQSGPIDSNRRRGGED